MAFVRKPTWIEYGPGPVVAPVRPPCAVNRAQWKRRGVAGAGVPYATYCAQASLWDPIAWLTCLPADVSHVASNVFGAGSLPTPPPAPPPNIALVSAATAANNPDAVYAGVDSTGAQVFAIPQTADANMAAYRAQVQTFMDGVYDANAPDCSTTWNQFTNSACGGSWLPLIAAGLLVGGFVLLGRRR